MNSVYQNSVVRLISIGTAVAIPRQLRRELESTSVTDLKPLAGLKKLFGLNAYVYVTCVSDPTPLASLVNLGMLSRAITSWAAPV